MDEDNQAALSVLYNPNILYWPKRKISNPIMLTHKTVNMQESQTAKEKCGPFSCANTHFLQDSLEHDCVSCLENFIKGAVHPAFIFWLMVHQTSCDCLILWINKHQPKIWSYSKGKQKRLSTAKSLKTCLTMVGWTVVKVKLPMNIKYTATIHPTTGV